VSRFRVWLLLVAGSGLYNIPRGNVDAFAAATWFGGLALVMHWLGAEITNAGRTLNGKEG